MLPRQRPCTHPPSFPPNTLTWTGYSCPCGHSLLPCTCLSEGGPWDPTEGIKFHVQLVCFGGVLGLCHLPLFIPLSFGGSAESTSLKEAIASTDFITPQGWSAIPAHRNPLPFTISSRLWRGSSITGMGRGTRTNLIICPSCGQPGCLLFSLALFRESRGLTWSSLVFAMSQVFFHFELLQSECSVQGCGDVCCPVCSLPLFGPSHGCHC